MASSALLNKSIISWYLILLSSIFFISFLIQSKMSSAGLPLIKNLTPLPINGVNTFSWLPASSILSIKKDVPTKPKPAEPTWQSYYQQYNNLPTLVAKWSKSVFLTFSLSLFNTLKPYNNLIILRVKIYIKCNKANNKTINLKGRNSNKCLLDKTVNLQ